MDEADPRSLVGSLIGDRYEVLEVLDRGAFSTSFRAKDQRTDGPILLRLFFCPADAPEDIERTLVEQFVRANESMSILSERSKAIVDTELGVEPHQLAEGRKVPYSVHEWLEGKTLDRVLAERSSRSVRGMDLRAVAQRLDGVLRLLVLAHDLGLVHRRLQPSRIWVEGEIDEDCRLKLDGFSGLLRPGEGPKPPPGIPGDPPSPHYAAPEQQGGDTKRVGACSDVYSVAMVILDMMLGRPAWEEWEKRAQEQREQGAEPGHVFNSPLQVGLLVPDAEAAVLACALESDPDHRFRSMREFSDALRETLSGEPPRWRKQAFSARAKISGSFVNDTPAPDPNARRTTAPPVVRRTANPPAQTPPRQTRRQSIPRLPLAATRKRGLAGLVARNPPLAIGSVAASIVAVAAFIAFGTGGSPSEVASPPTPPSPTPASANASCPEGMVYLDPSSGATAETRIAPFCFQRFEVTVAQYRSCSAIGSCKRAHRDSTWPIGSEDERAATSELCNERYNDKDSHPANCVDWNQANQYCRFRGWRLPSDAEWDFAARGVAQREFPWGAEAPDARRLNGCGLECRRWRSEHDLDDTEVLYESDDSHAGTAPDGSFAAGFTPEGVADLAGNVFEWVADSRPEDDMHPIRGGGFDQVWAESFAAAVRVWQSGTEHAHALGFRCAHRPD